jgi:hypothetical protein
LFRGRGPSSREKEGWCCGCHLNSGTPPTHVSYHLGVPPGHFTSPCIPSSAFFTLSPGKDARLFVFRLSAVQKGLEVRQAGRGRSDCRENKLEKTKGDLGLPVWVVSVQLTFFFSDFLGFTENNNNKRSWAALGK